MNWLHRLLNPHCSKCEESDREKSINETVEVLKSELASVRYENQQLMKAILSQLNPEPVEKQSVEVEVKPVHTAMGWRFKKQELEANDRKEAAIRREQIKEAAQANKSVEQLEKELLGDDDASKEREAV
jgi:hypothetical protein